MEILVQRLAGILLQVGVMDAHALAAPIGQLDVEMAGADDGPRELGGLVALGQVRIKVVLALEHRHRADLGGHREAEADRHLHRRAVEHR